MNSEPNGILSRRQLIESAAMAAGVAAALAAIPKQLRAADAVSLKKGATVLYQGDSITDAGRDRGSQGNANQARALGTGYPMLLGCELLRRSRCGWACRSTTVASAAIKCPTSTNAGRRIRSI